VGVTSTACSGVGGGVADDPQLDRVSTADSGVITRRLLTQLEFISYTSVEGKIQGTRRGLQWTQH
jgi:hypothetical protein